MTAGMQTTKIDDLYNSLEQLRDKLKGHSEDINELKTKEDEPDPNEYNP